MDTRRGGSICPVSSGPPIHSDHRLALVETEESTILGTPPTSRCFYALARQLPITCTYPILLIRNPKRRKIPFSWNNIRPSFWRRAFQSGTRASRAAVSPKGDSERVERVDREVAPVFRSFERIEASRKRGGAIGRSGAYARFGSLHASGHVRTRGGGVARDGLESASPTHDARETRREDRVMAEETTFWPDFDEDGANEDQAIDDFLNVLLEIDTDTVKNQGGTPGGKGYSPLGDHTRGEASIANSTGTSYSPGGMNAHVFDEGTWQGRGGGGATDLLTQHQLARRVNAQMDAHARRMSDPMAAIGGGGGHHAIDGGGGNRKKP